MLTWRDGKNDDASSFNGGDSSGINVCAFVCAVWCRLKYRLGRVCIESYLLIVLMAYPHFEVYVYQYIIVDPVRSCMSVSIFVYL